MFGWLSGIVGKVAIGIASLLMAVAGAISPSAKTELPQTPPVAIAVATTSETISTTTQPSGAAQSEQKVTSVSNTTGAATSKSIPSSIPPTNTANTQKSQPAPAPVIQNPTPSVQVLKPTIIAFTVSPSTATLGDTVQFTWSTQNAVSCAVPVADPSTLGVPFTGHLPQGTLSYVVTASNSSQNITYSIVCADKDWNTVSAQTVLQLSGPHVIGIPHTGYDSAGNKQLVLSFSGSSVGHVYCVNANYAAPNPPKIVDTVVIPDSNHNAAAAIKQDTFGGTPLGCVLEFGALSSGSSFVASGQVANFSVSAP